MPMYWPKYLADTSHLGMAEHGAYMLLIGHYWMTGRPLPDDDRMLARIVRASAREWRNVRPIIATFFHVENGEWRHGKVEALLDEAQKRYERRAKAGAAGGSSKRDAMLKPDGGNAEAMLGGERSNATAMRKHTRARDNLHPLTGDSEPDGSDAAASDPPPEAVTLEPEKPKPRTVEELLAIPTFLDRRPKPAEPVDLRKSIFDDGLKWLASTTGRAEQPLRPMIGKWCRDHGDEAVLTTIRAAMRSPPVDPISWIERSLRGNHGTQTGGGASFTEQVARIAARKAAAGQ